MRIKVLKLGHSTQELHNIEPGATVGQVIEEAAFSTSGYSLSLNGLGVAIDAAVNDGDIVTLVPKVEGGRA